MSKAVQKSTALHLLVFKTSVFGKSYLSAILHTSPLFKALKRKSKQSAFRKCTAAFLSQLTCCCFCSVCVPFGKKRNRPYSLPANGHK